MGSDKVFVMVCEANKGDKLLQDESKGLIQNLTRKISYNGIFGKMDVVGEE
jgi:hypothetical protein